MKVCAHNGRCGFEILIESLFRDGIASWVRIVNGNNKYVTETSDFVPIESVGSSALGKPAALVRPKLKPRVPSTFVSVTFNKEDGLILNQKDSNQSASRSRK